jgi:hypothetical protein
MADPKDPKGPQTPNPNLNNAMRDLESGERVLVAMEQHLRRISERGDEIGKKFKNVNLELTTAVELASNTEEAVKEISAAAKSLRRGILDTKSTKDALATVTAISKAQALLLDRTKHMPVVQQKVLSQQKEMQAWMEKLKNTTGELSDEEMVRLQKALHEIGREGENVAKIFKGITVNHLQRQIEGITGSLKAVGDAAGIGKGHSARVAKYAGFADAAVKIREAQRTRLEGNKEEFKKKRADALQAVKEKYGIDVTDPRAMRMAAKEQRQGATADFAKKLGIKGRLSQRDLGALAGYAAPTGLSKSVEMHGTGAVGIASKIASATEGGLAEFSAAIGEMAPMLAALEGAIMLLVKVFDGWTEQNKKIEASLGKGGLFQPGGGAGFGAARRGLTPESAYDLMGASFDRNLKIAQAITDQGLSVQEIIKAGQEEMMGGKKAYGTGPAGTGYMAGSTGLIQRAVIGAGRIAGLTDAEGVERVVKLLGDYRETLQQGENFFLQVGKGARAAGLSTTKYISLIDEVMDRFDRFNKSLDGTVSLLGQLGKTGRLAAEDIQQYLKFLTGGLGSQEAAGSSEQMFILSQMGKGERQRLAGTEGQGLKNLMARATGAAAGGVAELAIPGISADDLKAGFAGSSADALAFVRNKVIPSIDKSGADDTQKKSWNNLTNQMLQAKQNTEFWGAFASGKISPVGVGFGTKMGGMDLASSAAMQMGVVRFISHYGSLADFVANPETFAAQHKETVPLLELFKNNPQVFKNIQGLQTTAAGLRLGEAQQGEDAAQKLYAELDKTGLIKTLAKKGMKINFQDPSPYKKFFLKYGDDTRNGIANLDGTLDFWGDATAKQDAQASAAEKEATRKQAQAAATQTRSTADIFAAAFAKYFNSLIDGIQAIIDWLPGTDKAERKKDRQEAADNLKATGANFKDTQTAIDDLAEKAEADTDLSEYYAKKGMKQQSDLFARAATSMMQSQQDMQNSMSSGQFFSQADRESFFAAKRIAFAGGDKGAGSAFELRNRLATLKQDDAAKAAPTSDDHSVQNVSNTIIVGAAGSAPIVPGTAGKSNEKASTGSAAVTVQPGAPNQ